MNTPNELNEEEVKVNVILPFLRSCGFKEENLTLEKSFHIKLGRKTKEIGNKIEQQRPRLDILVKEHGKNLFIFEVKTDEKEIETDDIEQAISYARFLMPEYCPYAIVSNGKTTRLFDSYSGQELTSSKINESSYAKNGYKLHFLDLELQSYALSKLLTLSYDNLLTFCNNQIDDTMSRLRTEEKKLLRKYIPEVFVPRQKVLSIFHNFLTHESTCLLIDGNSGIGKTNILCDLVEQTRKDYPVLFFIASELPKDLASQLASEFNWEFSSHKTIEQHVSQLEHILKTHQKPLLIFIDGIDEWEGNPTKELGDFVKRLKEKNIKLILTCKSSKVNNFLRISDNPTILSQNLFVVNEDGDSHLTVSEFDFPELFEAIRKYSEYFSLKGFLTDSETFEACKDPFMLRVLAETFQGRDIPPSLNSKEIFLNYLDSILNKKLDKKSAIVVYLTKLAKSIYDKDNEEIFESDIVNIDYDSQNFLIDFGIIKLQYDELRRPKLRFNYDGLRNFVISYHVHGLDRLSNTDFERFVSRNISKTLGRELLKWYRNSATEDQIQISRKFIEEDDKKRAKEFLYKFREISERDFPFIARRLKRPDHVFGLLILYDEEINRVNGYGFKIIPSTEEEITWLRKQDWYGGPRNRVFDLMEQYGVSSITHSSRNFTDDPPETKAQNEILKITSDLIKERKLDERDNYGLASEKAIYLLSLLSGYGKLPDITPYDYVNPKITFPIDIKKIHAKLIEMFYSQEYELILVPGSPRGLEIFDLIESLAILSRKMETIDEPLLPPCDEPNRTSHYVKPSAEYFTEKGLMFYITKFFEKFLEEYKNLVERNFPTLKNQFPVYMKLPACVIGALKKRDDEEKPNALWYAIGKSDTEQNIIEISNHRDESINIERPEDEPCFYITTKNKKMRVTRYDSTVLWSFFLSNSQKYRNCIVLDWVYDTINDDLKSIFGTRYST